jgi:Leucine-rich repeat (LRR) protein
MAGTPSPGSATKRKRRWYHWLVPRFSLRTLLIAVTMFAIVCGYWIERSERQRQVAEFLTSRGVRWIFGPSPWFQPPKERDHRINHYLYPIKSFLYFTANDPKRAEVNEIIREVARLPSLEGIKFDMRGAAAVNWKPLTSAPVLTDLEISGVEFSEEDFKVFAAIPHLKRLELFAGGRKTKDISALAAATNLEELFVTLFEVDSLEVGKIPNLPRLRRLKLMHVDDRVCQGLAGSKTLEWLSLSQSDITDSGISVLRDMAALEQLDIGATCVGDPSVDALAAIPKLHTLYASNARLTFPGLSRLCEKGSVKEIALIYQAQNPPLFGIYGKGDPYPANGAIPAEVFLGKAPGDDSGITDINFPAAKLPKHFFDVLPHLTKLTSLRLSGTNVTDDDLSSIAKVSSLTYLDLDRTGISSSGLEKLSVLPSLARLFIPEPDDWNATAAVLQRFPALTEVRFGRYQLHGSDLEVFLDRPIATAQMRFSVNLNCVPLTNVTKSVLARDTTLKELHLAETGCTDDDLAFLQGYENIRVLSLAHNRVTDKIAPLLGSLRTLEALDLSDTEVTDATVEAIAKLPSLTLLRLNHTNVTDASVERLVANERLQELGLRGTRITDRVISSLKDMPNLQAFNVGPSYPEWLDENEQPQGAVSEATFAELKNFRAIEEVDVLLNELTPANVETLRAMPQLKRLTSQGVDLMSENFEQIVDRKSTERTVRVWYPKNRATSIGVPPHLVTAEDSQRQLELDSERVHLEGTKDTDKQIEKIVLAKTAIYVDLVNTDVTAQGIAKLKDLKSLRGLYLDGSDLGEEIVPSLVEMRRLRSLRINKSQLSRQSIEELAKLPLMGFLYVDMGHLSPDERQTLRAKYTYLYEPETEQGYKRNRAHR